MTNEQFAGAALLCEEQFSAVVSFLKVQFCDEVFFFREPAGKKVHIRTPSLAVARVSIHPKGSREATYVVIRLSPECEKQKIWFQLAFLGFKVHFQSLKPEDCRAQMMLPPK